MKSATVWQAGYTIVEVMIFLVISGAMLIGAFGLFNGRIQRTQFTQAVQEVASRIQNTANEAATGTYPDQPAFNCTVAAAVNSPPVFTNVSGTQGTRSQCVFVGKVMNFAVNGADTKADVYTAVGRRTTDGANSVATLTGANGALTRLVVGSPDITQSFNYGNGVHTTGFYQDNVAKTPISGLGFFQSFGGTYSGGNLSSGAQNVQLWFVRSSTPPVNPLSANEVRDAVAADTVGTPTLIGPNPNPGALICLAGGINQKAAIRINPATSGMNAIVTMDDPKC